MEYFIRSPYHSKIDGEEVWWRENSNGCTNVMAKAGIYSEKDKKRDAT